MVGAQVPTDEYAALKPSLQDLPHDMLAEIVKRVDSVDDLAALQLTSKSMQNVVKAEFEFLKYHSDIMRKCRLAGQPLLQQFYFGSGADTVDDISLRSLSRACIKSLSKLCSAFDKDSNAFYLEGVKKGPFKLVVDHSTRHLLKLPAFQGCSLDIKFSLNNFGPALSAAVKLLEKIPVVAIRVNNRQLNLADSAALSKLVDSVKQYLCLLDLSYSTFHSDNDIISIIRHAMKPDNSIATLRLNDIFIESEVAGVNVEWGNDACYVVAELLASPFNQIKELELVNMMASSLQPGLAIDDSGLQELASAIGRGHSKLRRLNLKGNKITWRGLNDINVIFSQPECIIEDLDLSHNAFDWTTRESRVAFRGFTNQLVAYNSLRSLALDSCQLAYVNMKNLVKLFTIPDNRLEKLNISFNRFRFESLRLLADTLRHKNCNLTKLECQVDIANYSEIAFSVDEGVRYLIDTCELFETPVTFLDVSVKSSSGVRTQEKSADVDFITEESSNWLADALCVMDESSSAEMSDDDDNGNDERKRLNFGCNMM